MRKAKYPNRLGMSKLWRRSDAGKTVDRESVAKKSNHLFIVHRHLRKKGRAEADLCKDEAFFCV
jgi:hypothetical protein